MEDREERRQEERKKHHRPLTYSLREAGFEVPDAQSPRKSGDKSNEGNASFKAPTRAQENSHMSDETQTQTQQTQQPQPPIPGGMENMAWGMNAFQNALNDVAKSYGKAKVASTLIDVGSFTLKAAVVVGVIAAGAAITKAILGTTAPVTVTALPSTPPVG